MTERSNYIVKISASGKDRFDREASFLVMNAFNQKDAIKRLVSTVTGIASHSIWKLKIMRIEVFEDSGTRIIELNRN
jgi:hypothetical protein